MDKNAASDFLWACVSLRNHRLCSARRGKILLRFPWRAASPLTSRERTTPGEHTHARTHTDMINGVGDWLNFHLCLSFSPVRFPGRLTHSPRALNPLLLSSSSPPLLRSDPSDINISDEMSKTTVWKFLNSNQKDSRPATAKKARPLPPSFPHFLTPSCGVTHSYSFCAA